MTCERGVHSSGEEKIIFDSRRGEYSSVEKITKMYLHKGKY